MTTAEQKSRLQLESHQVIIRPLVTEKGTFHSESERHNAYTFEVHPQATKDDIRRAVEDLFDGVRVAAVRTQTRKGKPRRHRFHAGHTTAWKKAIVKLHPESNKIAFF